MIQKEIVTKETIINGLNKLGVRSGDTLEVHSSLSSMCYVEGGANTVIESIIQVVGTSGTIIMSAYPISKPIPLNEEDRKMGIHWKVKRFGRNTKSEKTAMGAVVDEFVKRDDVILGQGTYRLCAWGRDKDKYVDGYEHIYNSDGKVLLLGVGIDRCSSLHLAEDIQLPHEIEKYFSLSEEVLAKYPPAKWSVGGEEPPGDAWGKVFIWAKEQGLVSNINIGKAECKIFSIKPLIDEYRRLRREDPWGLFEVERNPCST